MSKVKFACKCGQRLVVKQTRVGQMINCPACAQPVLVPSKASPVPEETYAGVERFAIQCECGKKVVIKKEAIGVKLFCPICRKGLGVENSESEILKARQLYDKMQRSGDDDDGEISLVED